MSNMSVDLSQITNVSTEPGELPPTMTAWVIRQEREGEPIEAFQLEEVQAQQLMHENKHAGKIAVLVGASEENQGRSGEPPAEPPAIRAEIGA